MRILLIAIAITIANCRPLPDTVNFVSGFVVGTGIPIDIRSLTSCSVDVLLVVPTAQMAIRQFKTGQVENIINAITDITGGLNGMAEHCGELALNQYQIYQHIHSILSNPNLVEEVKSNSYAHAEEVGRALAEIATSAVDGDTWTAGYWAGQLTRLVLNV